MSLSLSQFDRADLSFIAAWRHAAWRAI